MAMPLKHSLWALASPSLRWEAGSPGHRGMVGASSLPGEQRPHHAGFLLLGSKDSLDPYFHSMTKPKPTMLLICANPWPTPG